MLGVWVWRVQVYGALMDRIHSDPTAERDTHSKAATMAKGGPIQKRYQEGRGKGAQQEPSQSESANRPTGTRTETQSRDEGLEGCERQPANPDDNVDGPSKSACADARGKKTHAH
eukprot:1220498-Pyramimonas_sp.AAC.1